METLKSQSVVAGQENKSCIYKSSFKTQHDRATYMTRDSHFYSISL